MVGRTPEYLGKKIESYDVKMAMLYVLIFPLSILGFSAVSLMMPNPGPFGAGEYGTAWAFGDSVCVHVGDGEQRICIWRTEREHTLVQLVAGRGDVNWTVPDDCSDAGDCGESGKEEAGASVAGNVPVHTPLFTVLLVGVILIVGALTFFPALSLGPILEHLLMHAGKSF